MENRDALKNQLHEDVAHLYAYGLIKNVEAVSIPGLAELAEAVSHEPYDGADDYYYEIVRALLVRAAGQRGHERRFKGIEELLGLNGTGDSFEQRLNGAAPYFEHRRGSSYSSGQSFRRATRDGRPLVDVLLEEVVSQLLKLAEEQDFNYAGRFAIASLPKAEPEEVAHNQEGAEKQPVTRRRRRRIIAPVSIAILALLAAGTWVVLDPLSGDPSASNGTLVVTRDGVPSDLVAKANYPELVKGTGTETMSARGFYGKRLMIARSGIILVMPYGDIEIRLFPEPISCTRWYKGTPSGISFDISVEANAETLPYVPVGQPVRKYGLSWSTSHGNSSESDGVEFYFDGLSNHGTVVLTRIDTSPAGIWRGRITTPRKKTAAGKVQEFAGTFAAEWCDIEPRF